MSLVERVHIDLETLGRDHDAQVLSIGACSELSDLEFYVEIEIGAYDSRIFRRERATEEWWAEQGGFHPTTDAPVPPGTAVHRLITEYFDPLYKQYEEVEVWANSPSFDLAMLRYHFRHFVLACPWEYWQEQDFRTVRRLGKFLRLPVARGTAPHHALLDARQQCNYVEAVMATLARDRQLAVEAMARGQGGEE